MFGEVVMYGLFGLVGLGVLFWIVAFVLPTLIEGFEEAGGVLLLIGTALILGFIIWAIVHA